MRGSKRVAGPWSGRRVAGSYTLLIALVGVTALLSFRAGAERRPPPDVGGTYRIEAAEPCLGPAGTELRLEQSGTYLTLLGPQDVRGPLRLRAGRIEGPVACRGGRAAQLRAQVDDGALTGSVAGAPFALTRTGAVEPTRASAQASQTPAEEPSAEETFGQLMLAVAAVVLAGRLLGVAIRRLGQPQVMGEVLAGILLGPTLLGTVAPDVAAFLFPDNVIPLLRAAADIGLAFYMFLVGLELNLDVLRGRVEQAALVSHASIALPLASGFAVALPLYGSIGPQADFAPFALFMGVAMAITAFPVLARILLERRMLRRPVGALAMGAAAIDDVTAWGLLALATAVAGGGSGLTVVRILVLVVVFCAAMALLGRPLLSRVSRAYDEVGHVPAGWIAAVFVGVLLSSFAAQRIGVAAIFGAFVMGLIMPRRADLTQDVTRRIEDFVVTVLLPLFFVVTGLRVQVGLLDRPQLWLLTVALLGVAIAGKWLGAMGAARFTGLGWRESAALGALMNTRGLTELIVLNIGIELGVLSPALFTMLVIVALATTFMTGPALKLMDPRGELGERPEMAMRASATEQPVAPTQAILVASQDEQNLSRLLVLARPLARSEPPRELILARLLPPLRGAAGPSSDESALATATTQLQARRAELLQDGLSARALAFTSPDAGADMVRLATEQQVDLLLMDGRRPLLGQGVPRGAVGDVLRNAPCDVAVLIARDDALHVGAGRPVVVPFGGAEHDWAALELGAWVAGAVGAPLRLLGRADDGELAASGRGRDASRLLGNASLVLQQLAGIVAEPVLIEPGRQGILDASAGAGLLVVGLSERWRDEGLGPVRAELASSATAPILFVRRGTRPGALAPRDDQTRFTWSITGTRP
jgi:Kef-type K+ transport system membrane component KefB